MRLFCFKTVSDPTNDNSVSGSNVPRDQLLKVARQTVIFFFSRTRIYPILVTLQNLFRRPLNDIRLLQFCSRAPDESDHILNPSIHDFRETFRFLKRKRKRKRKKFFARENLFDFFLVLQKAKERDEIGGPETITVSDDFRNDQRRNIRVYQAKTFDLFLLSATWTERVITLNSNFHVPFALHGLSERRGGRAGRYTLAKIRILFPLCVYFLRKTIRENFTAIAFTIVSRSHCSSTSNRIELTG